MQNNSVELTAERGGWNVITSDNDGLSHKVFGYKSMAIEYARRECVRLGLPETAIKSSVPLT